MIRREVVVGHRRIVAFFGWTAGEVVAPVGAHVHPAGVDGQRQVLIQRLRGIKDKRVALARLHGQLRTDHARGFHRPGAAGVDHLPAGDGLSGRQPHGVHGGPGRVEVHANDFVGAVFDPALARRTPPPVKDGRAVEIALVDRVVAAGDDVVELVERELRRDLLAAEHARARAEVRLDLLVLAQQVGEGLIVGQIEITEALQHDIRHPLVPAHEITEVPDEVRAEL